jgi:hypothetical protein
LLSHLIRYMDEGLLGQVGQGLQGEECRTWSDIRMRICFSRLFKVCREEYLKWSDIWMGVFLARLVRVCRMRSISPGQVYG